MSWDGETERKDLRHHKNCPLLRENGKEHNIFSPRRVCFDVNFCEPWRGMAKRDHNFEKVIVKNSVRRNRNATPCESKLTLRKKKTFPKKVFPSSSSSSPPRHDFVSRMNPWQIEGLQSSHIIKELYKKNQESLSIPFNSNSISLESQSDCEWRYQQKVCQAQPIQHKYSGSK